MSYLHYLLSVFCCRFTLFALCLVYTMLPVSLDCQALIVPSIFSDVYVVEFKCTMKSLLFVVYQLL